MRSATDLNQNNKHTNSILKYILVKNTLYITGFNIQTIHLFVGLTNRHKTKYVVLLLDLFY